MNLDNQYTQHKERLNSSFIAKGNSLLSGTFIPADIKHLWRENSMILSWGDSTIMMSYYIAMLATEYHINNKVDTLLELRNTLRSLNRLDRNAEYSFDTSLSSDKLSGFFIRDDVYGDFLKDYPHLANGGIKVVQSDFYPKDGNIYLKEMSQDQFWHLLLGLSLVKKLITDEECIELAQNFVARVINHIDKNNWRIINPVTKQKVARGSDARLLSYAFLKAAKFINPNIKNSRLNIFNRVGFLIGRFGQRTLEKRNLNHKNYPFLSLSTVGNIGNLKYLTWHMRKHKYYEHFALIHKILHNKGDVSQFKKYYEDLLKTAPLVHTNYNNTKKSWNEYNWSSSSRLISPEHLGANNIHFNGEYNGIDFMLLYNLYKIVYER